MEFSRRRFPDVNRNVKEGNMVDTKVKTSLKIFKSYFNCLRMTVFKLFTLYYFFIRFIMGIKIIIKPDK